MALNLLKMQINVALSLNTPESRVNCEGGGKSRSGTATQLIQINFHYAGESLNSPNNPCGEQDR